jgi:hypothetical protein
MGVVLSEVYGKSDGKIFQDKYGPAGILIIGNVMTCIK